MVRDVLCSLVGGYKVLEEQSGSTVRMWFGYTFSPFFFAGAGSKSHAKIQNLWMTAPPPENLVLLFVGVFCNIWEVWKRDDSCSMQYTVLHVVYLCLKFGFSFSRTYRASCYYQSFYIHQLMHKWIVLKTIIKLTLKLLGKGLVQSHHHQGAHYSCLLKL
jgi:hypothetical protein